MAPEEQQAGLEPSCRLCKHYRVSWDPSAPHACTALGFKSSKLPSIVVYETSGIECQAFSLKSAKSEKCKVGRGTNF